MLRRLEQGERATDIVAVVSDPANDKSHFGRQLGVVSLHGGEAVTAGFSGAALTAWAGRSDSVAHAVTVQGNFLESEAVVHDALRAFVEAEGDGVVLADRLLRAIEAGSAAGGDVRCNDEDVVQTCMSAFVSVARGDQPSFAVQRPGETSTRICRNCPGCISR